MNYLELETMQKTKVQAKLEVRRSDILKFFDSEFQRLQRISELAKQLDPKERQDLVTKLVIKEAVESIVSAHNEN